jgi:putative transposase
MQYMTPPAIFSSQKPRPTGRSRYRFGEAGFPHFLTNTIVGWLPVFTRPETVQIVLDSWQFLQDQVRLALLGFVIVENHIHFIASA